MKKLVVITHPGFLPDESYLLKAVLDAGADYLHLRKPQATRNETEQLLQLIPAEYHSRIVLHDWHDLAEQYAVGGIHLNSRNKHLPLLSDARMSRSCHSLEEVTRHKSASSYLFLSPICDSISKAGYHAAFTHDMLLQAARQGVIDDKVIALGGIAPDNIEQVMQYGFGGVAVMGCLWQTPQIETIKQKVKQIKEILTCYNL